MASMNLKLISGNSNIPLAKEIARYLQRELIKSEITKFSDEEIFVKINENVRGDDVFVIQSTSYPVNDNLMELLVIIDTLKRSSARRITAVIPYFGYARQDRKTQPRVPITAKLVSNLITAAGANRVLTMDLHAGQIQGFFDIPLDNLEAKMELVDYVGKYIDYIEEDLVIISPDAGGVERARQFAKKLNGSLAIIDKKRERANEVSELKLIGDVEGKVCIIVDDIVDTAGTLAKACFLLKEKGAYKIYSCCSHGVLSGTSYANIDKCPIEKLIITDSIYDIEKEYSKKCKIISISKLFAKAIKCIHGDLSISSLFE